ncbi:MAG: HPF/RaiA family ribosome-associated protein [Nitrospira sp.]|jgi:ribosome-associated translation inhibitor RaiA|nr:MAG: HPF/RaiA family ribosome-associated protein [Nitrospira sp.]
MQIQVNTDNHIHRREEIVALVETSVEGAVGRFRDRITRVEAHLSDTNSHKTKGDDIRCVLEARLAGHQPIAVTHQASTVELALSGAADKLERSVESTLDRLKER